MNLNNPNIVDITDEALVKKLNADIIDFDRMKYYDDDTGRERGSLRKSGDEWYCCPVHQVHFLALPNELQKSVDSLYGLYLAERIVK